MLVPSVKVSRAYLASAWRWRISPTGMSTQPWVLFKTKGKEDDRVSMAFMLVFHAALDPKSIFARSVLNASALRSAIRAW